MCFDPGIFRYGRKNNGDYIFDDNFREFLINQVNSQKKTFTVRRNLWTTTTININNNDKTG
jgi:hypothetical protein